MMLGRTCFVTVLASSATVIGTAPSVVAQDSAVQSVDAVQPGVQDVRRLIEGTHMRLVFDEDVVRVAVGRSQTLSVEILSSRELLALGEESGRTSLVVWYADGHSETLLFAVEPDFSLLRTILADIHPSISIELAPDRDAVVLRGVVPGITYRQAAEAAAVAYLESEQRSSGTTPLITGSGGNVEGDDQARVRVDEAPGGGTAVINLIQLGELPHTADVKIRRALEPVVGSDVTVRRVLFGDIADDSQDLFVLEGEVPDQVTLSRVLFLASRVLLGGQQSGRNDIRVLADEGGALVNVTNLFGAAAVGGGQAQQQQGIGGNIPGSGGNRGGQQLANRIGANLGRAKVIEAAGGRILAMIQVEHLPLVRVDVRLYEVNLTRLRQWRNDLGVIVSDFDQGALDASPLATELQGANAASVGPDQIQDVVRFVDGGLTNQVQFVTGGLAVDDVFQYLEREEIARSLSRPSMTVLSGEQALFQVGGQVPVPVAITVGGGTDQVLNSVEFRDFGVQLTVRPLVEELDEEVITLDVSPTVSLPDLQLTAAIGAVTGTSTNTTAFETRAARTHTRLRDGEAMLIGGLISSRQETAIGKTPGLGDVPLAGWLFRNESSSAEELELFIVVNPVIVRQEKPEAQLWLFDEPADVLGACLASLRPASQANEQEATDDPEANELDEDSPNGPDSGNHTTPAGIEPVTSETHPRTP